MPPDEAPLLRQHSTGPMGHVDCERIVAIAELRAAIMALPSIARQELRVGPRAEPGCGICSSVGDGDMLSDAEALVTEHHIVGALDVASLPGIDLDLEDVAEAWTATPDTEKVIKALAGALAAERALVVYLLAGWKPWGDQAKHARAALAERSAA